MPQGREIVAASLLAVAFAGCGGEQTFTAEEFVDEVNAQGVEIRLGGALQGTEGKELREITLAPLPGLPPPAPGEEKRGKGGTPGTLYVFEDADAAEEQLTACRNSATLVCYRASNVVVLFEEAGIEAQRLALAMQKLAD